MPTPSRCGSTTSTSFVSSGVAMTERVLPSDFQNRRATATFTSSSQGNPFRTLPKGKKDAYMRGNVHAQESEQQNPRRANNDSKVWRSSLVAGPSGVAAAAAATAAVVPKWEVA